MHKSGQMVNVLNLMKYCLHATKCVRLMRITNIPHLNMRMRFTLVFFCRNRFPSNITKMFSFFLTGFFFHWAQLREMFIGFLLYQVTKKKNAKNVHSIEIVIIGKFEIMEEKEGEKEKAKQKSRMKWCVKHASSIFWTISNLFMPCDFDMVWVLPTNWWQLWWQSREGHKWILNG